MEFFERAAEARGRILRVQQWLEEPGSTSVDASRGKGVLLTFDIGRILVSADAAADALEITQIEDPAAVPGPLASLDEEEPWWAVLGNPITRAWPGATGDGASASVAHVRDVRLQFREDDENPKVVSLRLVGSEVCTAVETTQRSSARR